jgi:hypothetical protein
MAGRPLDVPVYAAHDTEVCNIVNLRMDHQPAM